MGLGWKILLITEVAFILAFIYWPGADRVIINAICSVLQWMGM